MTDTASICIHCYVTGTVQGVWFRASTKGEADKLGLTGWVRNLADGRVEVLACGQKDAIEKLRTWLQRGPEKAQVTQMLAEEVPTQAFEDFQVI